jgi:23S rRNA (guanosine2251-2'-O)-methyltransferase
MKRRGRDIRNPRDGSSGGQWLFGVHSVLETLRAKPKSIREVRVLRGDNSPTCREIIDTARGAQVQLRYCDRNDLDRISHGSRHQGVAALVLSAAGATLAQFFENLGPEEKAATILVALDQIQDPHNLGAIARSAVNFGASGLIIPERRSAPASSTAVAASAGALQKIRVFSVVNLAQSLELCRENGFWIYGADMGGVSSWQASLNRPLVLVIGSEGSGLRELVRESCDEIVSIPQSAGGVASLNASCAAAVLLYEIMRRAGVRS